MAIDHRFIYLAYRSRLCYDLDEDTKCRDWVRSSMKKYGQRVAEEEELACTDATVRSTPSHVIRDEFEGISRPWRYVLDGKQPKMLPGLGKVAQEGGEAEK